ncbi:MAG: hypothetical protein HQ559_08490, partial [Lentisphaerae bacterium]|nr:hypothetical protein [Lentisphaerota bacterium]
MHLDPVVTGLAGALESPLQKQIVDLPAGLPASAQALVVWAAHVATGRTVVWVTDGPKTLETAHTDLLTLLSLSSDTQLAEELVYYPSWETFPGQDPEQDPDLTGLRLSALARISCPISPDAPRASIVTTCIQALMQKTVSPEELRHKSIEIRTGGAAEMEDLAAALEAASYCFEAEVVAKGQAALRGGILDLWPPTEPWPLRIEAPESTVESIRAFDPATQRSRGRKDSVLVLPASEWDLSRPLRRGKATP